jgi:hypothetical protein
MECILILLPDKDMVMLKWPGLRMCDDENEMIEAEEISFKAGPLKRGVKAQKFFS